MEINLENISIFKGKTIKIDKEKAIVYEKSAHGKTSIARVLYAFLTGEIDASIVSCGEEEGKATITLNGNTYNLIVNAYNPKLSKVDRISFAPYAKYLVFVDGSPIHKFFISPDSNLTDIDNLIKEVLKEPPELIELESRLQIMEKSLPEPEKIDEYEKTIARYQEQLKEVEEELAKVEEEISKREALKGVEVVLKKMQVMSELAKISEEIKKLEEEKKTLAIILQDTETYENLRERAKELKAQLHTNSERENIISKAKEAYEIIRNGLVKLDEVIDVLADLNLLLFGNQVDGTIIRFFLKDCDTTLSILSTKLIEIRNETNNIIGELRKIEQEIKKYSDAYTRVTSIDTTLREQRRREENLKYTLARIEQEIKNLEKVRGEGEETMLKKLQESTDLNELIMKRAELSKRKIEITSAIKSFTNVLEAAKKEVFESEQKMREYEELKAKYNHLKNEYRRKINVFKETFIESLKTALKNGKIPDLDRNALKLLRAGHTYSQSERFYIAVTYIYSLVKSLQAINCKIPLVVIDVISPLDTAYKHAFLDLFKELDVREIILMTSDSSAVEDLK